MAPGRSNGTSRPQSSTSPKNRTQPARIQPSRAAKRKTAERSSLGLGGTGNVQPQIRRRSLSSPAAVSAPASDEDVQLPGNCAGNVMRRHEEMSSGVAIEGHAPEAEMKISPTLGQWCSGPLVGVRLASESFTSECCKFMAQEDRIADDRISGMEGSASVR
jgi:hypothetical protein